MMMKLYDRRITSFLRVSGNLLLISYIFVSTFFDTCEEVKLLFLELVDCFSH